MRLFVHYSPIDYFVKSAIHELASEAAHAPLAPSCFERSFRKTYECGLVKVAYDTRWRLLNPQRFPVYIIANVNTVGGASWVYCLLYFFNTVGGASLNRDVAIDNCRS